MTVACGIALALAVPAVAADWKLYTFEGLELSTDAGARPARETLNYLEQFRHAMGRTLGKPDVRVPAEVLLFRDARDARRHAPDGAIQPGSDRVRVALVAGAPLPPGFLREWARLHVVAGSDRMPEAFERGIVALFSTLDVAGTHVTLGRAPPPAERDEAWARVHLLSVDPEYYGKLSVLLTNLQRGVDEDVAYRNAFGATRAEIDRRAAAHLKSASFATVEVTSRAISAERDFVVRDVDPAAMAERLKLLAVERERRAEYIALLQAGSPEALQRASSLQPRQAEPHFRLAQTATDGKRRIELLKKAIELDRRQSRYWAALAEAWLAEKQFGEAAKAWRSAEQAATTSEEQTRMRQARLDIDRQRLDYEEAERRRLAEEKEREIRKLKEAAIAELRAIEARVNQGATPAQPGEKVVPWWDGPAPSGKVAGKLKQVDCLSGVARLVIEDGAKRTTRVVVRDRSRIAVVGSKEASLGCGVQKPRDVVVEFFPKPDAKLGTAGDVATIEFR